ncbi:S-methyl-5-thioribose kinase [Erwiniaceae bacterium BAC15a-03b]|uniref:Methylthioribose kinase n=1 Tax=Winslowiella arboricola TaxID=2978220 RepID=A0A9J6PL51_9GAMM|nr:S-methyl-5-thioribose kinase [Winslowiella arboricola]MCU5771535.1 S-methyl-5-thioribose kinase [Winslowiella arboricola]MCU5776408.1 S-methyl-5-thioribose kinase [Winslowiella arboricola]
MSQYRTFTAADAVDYARQFGGLDDPSSLVDAQEIGDGNLNLVFKIFDQAGRSRIIVKQALPYVRCVGESWPLTLDRARLEAETLQVHGSFCPQHTVKILHFDADLAVMVMEDLSDHAIWRGELVKGSYFPQAAAQLGEYLAQTLFHTSDFFQHPHAKKADVIRFTNPELCEMTEDLFFNEPYQIHERNAYPATLESFVAELRDDHELRIAVAGLKHHFLAHAEALLHGDIHSGSIFVTDSSLKAIDAEFGFYGPIGFDIGTAIGNLLINYCALPGLLAAREAADGREQRLADVREVWLGFAERFLALAAEKTRDQALAYPGYAEAFLQRVLQDTIGFCGTELIRRTVGISQVADIKKIASEPMRDECLRHAISLGRTLILAAPHVQDIDALIARVRQNG